MATFSLCSLSTGHTQYRNVYFVHTIGVSTPFQLWWVSLGPYIYHDAVDGYQGMFVLILLIDIQWLIFQINLFFVCLYASSWWLFISRFLENSYVSRAPSALCSNVVRRLRYFWYVWMALVFNIHRGHGYVCYYTGSFIFELLLGWRTPDGSHERSSDYGVCASLAWKRWTTASNINGK